MPNKPRKQSKSKSEKAAPINPAPHPTAPLDPEEVARLAYSYWEARGRGSPEEDWLKAENELRTAAQLKQSTAAQPMGKRDISRKSL